MLVLRARHVRLVQLAEHVLVLHGVERGGRARQIAQHRLEGRLLGRLGGGDELLRAQRLGKPAALDDAFGALALGTPVIVDREGLAQIGIEPAPPADEGREVVRGDDRHGAARIGLRAPERAVGLALELEHAVAHQSRAHDRVRETLRRGAEVLGDDHAAVPVALEPEHRELRLERVGDIGAFRRRLAGRDQEQPLQLEGVVDTNRASVAHVCCDERAKGREPLVLEGQRVERRQSPILSLRPEKIGRRADRKTFAEPLRTRPDLGAATVGAHGEVAVEADVHPGGARAPAGRLELAIREPLQPGMERDPLRVVGAEAPDRGRGGGAVRFRPFAEPSRTLGAEML